MARESRGRFGKILDAMGATHLARHHLEGVSQKAFTDWAAKKKWSAAIQLEAYVFSQEFEAKLAVLLDDGEGGVVRADLVEYLVSMVVEDADQKELLEEFRNHVSPLHYEMIRIAVGAQNLRELGRAVAARNLVESAERKMGPDAKKISNLLSTGYLSNYFVWKLRFCKFEFQTGHERMYREWFESQLGFFERAIFVGENVDKDHVGDELAKRLETKTTFRQSSVNVFAAGRDYVQFTHDVLSKWVEGHHGFEFNVEVSNLGRKKPPTARFLVFNVKENKKQKRSRLAYMWERE